MTDKGYPAIRIFGCILVFYHCEHLICIVQEYKEWKPTASQLFQGTARDLEAMEILRGVTKDREARFFKSKYDVCLQIAG